jgi:hypothetical protein
MLMPKARRRGPNTGSRRAAVDGTSSQPNAHIQLLSRAPDQDNLRGGGGGNDGNGDDDTPMFRNLSYQVDMSALSTSKAAHQKQVSSYSGITFADIAKASLVAGSTENDASSAASIGGSRPSSAAGTGSGILRLRPSARLKSKNWQPLDFDCKY